MKQQNHQLCSIIVTEASPGLAILSVIQFYPFVQIALSLRISQIPNLKESNVYT